MQVFSVLYRGILLRRYFALDYHTMQTIYQLNYASEKFSKKNPPWHAQRTFSNLYVVYVPSNFKLENGISRLQRYSQSRRPHSSQPFHDLTGTVPLFQL